MGAIDVLGCGARCLARTFELALEIGEGHIDIAHGHVGIYVTEQLHQHWETDS
jgi:hypothetical protein